VYRLASNSLLYFFQFSESLANEYCFPGNRVDVIFTSDSSGTDRGFNITFNASTPTTTGRYNTRVANGAVIRRYVQS